MTRLNWNRAKRCKGYIGKWYDRNYVNAKTPTGNRITLNRERSMANCRELVKQGIEVIGATLDKLERGIVRGAYGKQALLETIYTVYTGWRNRDDIDGIRAVLAGRLDGETIEADAHILELLIRLAVPDTNLDVVGIWVDAIRYGETRHVRPFKLRGFFFAKGGLVRCARLYRQEDKERLDQEEERARGADQERERDREERRSRMKDTRKARRRERQLRSVPVGKWGLYDR